MKNSIKLLGADFEVFVYEKGNLVNCKDLLPNATKSNPITVGEYLITHDRYSLECSIPPFENAPLALYWEVRKGINILEEFLKTRGDYKIKLKSYTKAKEYHTWSKGRESNIYKTESSEVKEITNNILTSGFHIHFSGIIAQRSLIRTLDRTIGIFYKLIEPFSKRKDYGKLGSFKYKQYGLLLQGFEYRVLGAICLRRIPLFIISLWLYYIVKKY